MNTDWGPLRRASNLAWIPLVLVSSFLTAPEQFGAVSVVASLVAAAGWVITGLRLEEPPWLVPAGIVTIAAGGITALAAMHVWAATLAFPFYAVLSAGARLPVLAAAVITLLTGAGVALAAHTVTLANLTIILVSLLAALLFGMGRRESRKRAEERELTLVADARVHEEHARAAALAERARIARDVHDVLAHSLSALAVQLQGARLMLQRDGAAPDTIAQVERAQRLAADGLAEARRAVTALRSEPVDVTEGLRALVADAPGASLEIDGEPVDLSATARETLLRTAQEALSNARKHAAGAPVTVRLSHRGGATELEVHDRVGSPPPRRGGGYGLIGMAERAALAGAHLDAGPVADGWRVLLSLPDATEAT
ncbi:sensor histidine kinase [Pseudonocardia sp. GCM10023141]|uniref:sensor histidine kinase n=1 Tax=Pseudonocardia sp. GCM10023141 TaxID=3252653 RepID=UPI00361F4B3B